MMKRLSKTLSQLILVSVRSLLSQGKEREAELYIFLAFECGAECPVSVSNKAVISPLSVFCVSVE